VSSRAQDAPVDVEQSLWRAQPQPTVASLQLALRLAGFFGLPMEAIFSNAPFSPLSEQLYRGGPTAAAREASA
jgi:hypothetical protein